MVTPTSSIGTTQVALPDGGLVQVRKAFVVDCFAYRAGPGLDEMDAARGLPLKTGKGQVSLAWARQAKAFVHVPRE
jgi:hypothetical protein